MTILNEGAMNGGMTAMGEENGDAGPQWLTYFTAISVDGIVGRLDELGGDLLVGPMDLGSGKIAVVADLTGAPFAVFEGEPDD